jgi:nucleoside 2-deoxyribosyltransferase
LNRAFTAYLAGPITGLSYDGATDWRDLAVRELAPFGIKALSPLRSKEYLRGVESFSADGDVYRDLSMLSTNRGIMTRDRHDATTCDVLLVNLLGAARISIGTVMEIAWADACRTPVVCAIEPAGNPHEHGMITEAIGFRVPTLAGALDIVKAIAGNAAA